MSDDSEQIPRSWQVKMDVRRRLILLGGAWFGVMVLSIVVLYSVGLNPSPPSWLGTLFPLYWLATFLVTTGLGAIMLLEGRRAHSIPGFGLGLIALLLPSVLLGRSVIVLLGDLLQYLKLVSP